MYFVTKKTNHPTHFLTDFPSSKLLLLYLSRVRMLLKLWGGACDCCVALPVQVGDNHGIKVGFSGKYYLAVE